MFDVTVHLAREKKEELNMKHTKRSTKKPTTLCILDQMAWKKIYEINIRKLVKAKAFSHTYCRNSKWNCFFFVVYMWVIFIIFQGVPRTNLHVADSLYHWFGVNAPCIVCLFVCLYAIGRNGQTKIGCSFFIVVAWLCLNQYILVVAVALFVLFAAIFTCGFFYNLTTRTKLCVYFASPSSRSKSRMFG